MSRMFKTVKKCELVKIVENCQRLSKIVKLELSKVVKTIKNCEKFKNFKSVKQFQRISELLIRSCLLISLIECLKDHKSLASLCMF